VITIPDSFHRRQAGTNRMKHTALAGCATLGNADDEANEQLLGAAEFQR